MPRKQFLDRPSSSGDYIRPDLRERSEAWGRRFALVYAKGHADQLEAIAREAITELGAKPPAYLDRQLTDLIPAKITNKLEAMFNVTTFGELESVEDAAITSTFGLGVVALELIREAQLIARRQGG